MKQSVIRTVDLLQVHGNAGYGVSGGWESHVHRSQNLATDIMEALTLASAFTGCACTGTLTRGEWDRHPCQCNGRQEKT